MRRLNVVLRLYLAQVIVERIAAMVAKSGRRIESTVTI